MADADQKKPGRVSLIVWGLIGTTIAALCFVGIFRVAARMIGQYESGAWPSVPGTLLTSEHGPRRSYRDYHRMSYEYTVGGTKHLGTWLRYADNSAINLPSNQLPISFMPGPCVVYYDPAEPGVAVLLPGFKHQNESYAGLVILSFVGVFSALIGLAPILPVSVNKVTGAAVTTFAEVFGRKL